MADRLLQYGAYLSKRLQYDVEAQADARTSVLNDDYTFNAGRYAAPLKRLPKPSVQNLFQVLLEQQPIEFTAIETLLMQHLEQVIAKKGQATLLDYGGRDAESARVIAKAMKKYIEAGQLTVIATSLSPTKPWHDPEGLVTYISGDVHELAQRGLTGSIDAIITRNALTHSLVPGVALTSLANLLSGEGIFIGDNLLETDTLDHSDYDEIRQGKIGRSRRDEWNVALDYNFPFVLGLRSLTEPREVYNYQIFVAPQSPTTSLA